MNTKGMADKFGNINAEEGCDRCFVCGCKYWENDRCTSCDTMVEVSKNRQMAAGIKYMNQVKLNVMFTTMLHHEFPWVGTEPVLDLEQITTVHRALGNIR